MSRNLKLLALPAVSLLLAASPAWASLDGTAVTGSLQFTAPPPTGPNYFDPANGYVDGPNGVFPGGSLNSAGTTVTISSTAVEFGYEDAANTDSADFTGTQLTVTDLESSGANPWTMIFTDPAFTSVAKVSDNFIDGGLSDTLVGDTLTINWAGGGSSGSYQGVFNVGSVSGVPDAAGTFGLFGLGLLSLAALKRFKYSSV